MVKQATENKPEVNKTNQTYTLKNGKRDHCIKLSLLYIFSNKI